MTPQEKKQLVRETIIRAVPGVMNLKFGCKVMFNDHERIIITNERGYVTFDIGGPMENLKVERLYKIIGRPITLQDIIYTLKKNEPEMFGAATVSNQMKMQAPLETKIKNIVNAYDLLQDFDHQSEEVYDFLYELLCV